MCMHSSARAIICVRTDIIWFHCVHRRFYQNITDQASAANLHNTHADRLLLQYYTPGVARDALHFLAPDYRRLKLPVPGWALALLGEHTVSMILFSREANQSVLYGEAGFS